ncbi:MAG: SGNH/GDSL hydrolase family protein, partial [Bryobacteraceae bacterium]
MMKTAIFLALALASSLSAAETSHWVVTWGASPAPQLATEAEMRAAKLQYENQTLREIVHTSIGGSTVRVRFSNAYGKQTVDLGAAHLALRAKGHGIAPASDRALTFGGRPAVSIPPNALVLSDPVKLEVPASADLAISIFVPKATNGAGIHYAAQQTSYVAAGDQTGAASIDEPATITSWIFLTGVEVLAPDSTAAVVAFGDSITDGARSTVDANLRWPNILSDRLQAQRKGRKIG